MTNTKKSPTVTDAAIGARVRSVRMALGISQEKLGEALGITFQQVQKYEKGTNRIPASRLVAIARTCGVSVSDLVGEDRTLLAPAAELLGLDPDTARIVRLCARLTEDDRARLRRMAEAFQPREAVA